MISQALAFLSHCFFYFLITNEISDSYRLAGLLAVSILASENEEPDRHETGSNDGKWLAMGPVVTARAAGTKARTPRSRFMKLQTAQHAMVFAVV